MSCQSPLPWDVLVDWWARDLAPERAAALEEHLLGCEECARQASRVAATAEAVRTMVPPVLRPDRLRRLERAGWRIVENPIAAGQTSDFHFPTNVDLAIHVLGGLELRQGMEVEVTLRSMHTGDVLGRFPRAPFDPDRQALYLACQRDYAQLGTDLLVEVRTDAGRAPARYTILHHF